MWLYSELILNITARITQFNYLGVLRVSVVSNIDIELNSQLTKLFDLLDFSIKIFPLNNFTVKLTIKNKIAS